jgi:hypothetical protein
MHNNYNKPNYNELIWEEKGMILGVIKFLTQNIHKYSEINIDNKLFYKVIKFLFPQVKINKSYNDNDKSLNIYVKRNNVKNNGLIINNLDNLDEIKTKKKYFSLLPWFNYENPIVMFKFDEKQKNHDIDDLYKKIKKVHKKRMRYMDIGNVPLDGYKCKFVFWDILYEYKILNKYCEKFDGSPSILYKLLNKYFNNFNCSEITNNIIYLSVPQPYQVYMSNGIKQQSNSILLTKQKTQHNNSNQPKNIDPNQPKNNKFLALMNRKMHTMNTLLQDQINK